MNRFSARILLSITLALIFAGNATAVPPKLRDSAAARMVAGRLSWLPIEGTGFLKYELLVDGQKVAEGPSETNAVAWTPPQFGNYAVSIRGIKAQGVSETSLPVQVLAGLPDWSWRNPSPSGADWASSVRVAGQTWLVGWMSGAIIRDDNGAIKTLNLGEKGNIYSIAHGAGRFVAIKAGYDRRLQKWSAPVSTSTDGLIWNSVEIPGAEASLAAVSYANGLWVAVGYRIATSTDALNWTLRGTASAYAVAYGNGIWVAPGYDSIATSTDGITWTAHPTNTTNQPLQSIAYLNGRFVVTGIGLTLTSTDGISWQPVSALAGYSFDGVYTVRNRFIAVGWYGTMQTSTDGLNWSAISLGEKLPRLRTASGDDQLVTAAGLKGEIFTSTDLVTWTERSSGSTVNRTAALYAAGRYVVTSHGYDQPANRIVSPISTSTDGRTWVDGNLGNPNPIDLFTVTHGSNRWIAAGGSGCIYTSSDALTWTPRTSNITTHLTASASSPSLHAIAGVNGALTTSSDGTNWTPRVTGTTAQFNAAIFAGNQFVFIGEDGVILTSPDGQSWTKRASGVSSVLSAITWSENVGYIVVGQNETILTSKDGISWTTRRYSSGADWFGGVANTPYGIFVISKFGTDCYLSLDGVTWLPDYAPNPSNLASLATGAKSLLQVGDGGRILETSITNEVDDGEPTILVMPLSQNVLTGATVSLSVTAGGKKPLTYQWRKNGVPLFSHNPATLSIPSASTSDAAIYSCLIANDLGWTMTIPATLTVISPPTVLAQPQPQVVQAGGIATMSVIAEGTPRPSYQWLYNGQNILGAVDQFYTVPNLQPSQVGLYSVRITVVGYGSIETQPALLALTTQTKVAGAATQIATDIRHPNGNIYDQVLLQGSSATITAEPGEVTRLSYLDLSDDIVQVEFSGSGSLTIALDNASGPALPTKYNQSISYMKGHATLTIAGASANTHVSVFTVGTATAVNQSLFKAGTSYDGVADLATLSIASVDGRFGGVRLANAEFSGSRGYIGLYARGVAFAGPVNLLNLSASNSATPVLLTGPIDTGRIGITGGDMLQPNAKPIQLGDATTVGMLAGATSHNVAQPAQANKGVYERNGVNVTAQVVQGP